MPRANSISANAEIRRYRMVDARTCPSMRNLPQGHGVSAGERRASDNHPSKGRRVDHRRAVMADADPHLPALDINRSEGAVRGGTERLRGVSVNAYTQQAGTPNNYSAHVGIFNAARIAVRYRATPTIKQLMYDFNMSRATAYRWRAAFLIARGEK